MTCKNCGKRLRKKDTFCPGCGLAAENVRSGKSSKKKLFLGIIAAVLALLLIGTAGYFLWPALVPQAGPFTVSFDCNADSQETDYEPNQQTVAKGEAASRPPFPTREGYLFGGWYLDASCTQAYDFSSAVNRDLVLYANWQELGSDEAALTQQEIQDYNDCTQALEDSFAGYLDEEGYVDRADFQSALDAMETVAQQWKDKGVVVYYERNDSNLYLEFSSCLTYIQSLPEKDRLSSNPKNAQLILPFLDQNPEVYYPIIQAVGFYEDGTINMAQKDEITLKSLATMEEAADLFLWQGHGSTAFSLGNCLQIEEESNFPALVLEINPFQLPEEELRDEYYDTWCLKLWCEKYITVCNNKYAILDKFIETYFPPMDGSIVIMNVCYSCTLDNLANAFHNLGAQVVLGYSNAVYQIYACEIVYALLHYMTTENEEGRYDTVQEALEKAKAIFGAKDNGYSEMAMDPNLIPWNQYASVFDKILAQGSISGYLYGNHVSSNTEAVLKRNDDYQWESKDSCEYTLWSGLTGTLVVTDSEGKVVEQNGQSLTLTLTDETGTALWDSNSTGGSFAVNRLEDSERHTYTLTISLNGTKLKQIDAISIPAHRYLDLGEIQIALDYETQELFASQVVQFIPGNPWTEKTDAQDPSCVLGKPDSYRVTLGGSGSLVVSFEEEFTDIDGTDVIIYEGGVDKESVEVAVSADGESWYTVGTTGGGTSEIDLNGQVPEGMYFKYVRIIDQRSALNSTWPGADIDAISIHVLQATGTVPSN